MYKNAPWREKSSSAAVLKHIYNRFTKGTISKLARQKQQQGSGSLKLSKKHLQAKWVLSTTGNHKHQNTTCAVEVYQCLHAQPFCTEGPMSTSSPVPSHKDSALGRAKQHLDLDQTRPMGLAYIPTFNCRHIWHTWSVWDGSVKSSTTSDLCSQATHRSSMKRIGQEETTSTPPVKVNWHRCPVCYAKPKS